CCRRISLAWLGGRAWSLTRRASGSHLSGHSLLPAVAPRLASVLCRLDLFMAVARVATGSGIRAGGDFRSSDHLLGNRFDLLPRGVGKALARGAFRGSNWPDPGHCRRRPVALFQCATRVPAWSPSRASRCVVRRDDPLPCDRRIDVGPCMASFWKTSGTVSARRALFRCPCLWRCGRSKPLGAKLAQVVRDFAAHIPFHAGGVRRTQEPGATRYASRRQACGSAALQLEGHHQAEVGVPAKAILDALGDLPAA